MISPASAKRLTALQNDLKAHLATLVGARPNAANGRLDVEMLTPLNATAPTYRITLSGTAFAATNPMSWTGETFKDALEDAEANLRAMMSNDLVAAEIANDLADAYAGKVKRANALSDQYIAATLADLRESVETAVLL